MEIPRGKIIEAEGDMSYGTLGVVVAESEPVEGTDKYIIKNSTVVLEEDSSLGSSLIALGIIKSESEHGRDVVVFRNPNDEIQWPDNLIDVGDDEE